MPSLDPQAQALLDRWAEQPTPPTAQRTVASVREADREVQQLQTPPEPVGSTQAWNVPTEAGQIPMRVYSPPGEPPFPVLIYFHGGGFVIDGASYESPLRALTNRSGCLICSVQYRLAPENPFPAAIDDAFAATAWVARHAARLGGDADCIALGGDSSGGNLAAVVTMLNRHREAASLRMQVLIYPMLDATCSQPSARLFATGYGFTTEKATWYFDQYLPPHVDRRDPRVSPLFEPILRGLPPAFIASAACDPLRDEAEQYAHRLRVWNVPVTLKRYPGMIHGFFQMAGALDQGQQLIDDVGTALRDTFASSSPPA